MRILAIGLAFAALALGGCKKPEAPRAFSQAALDQALADPARKSQADAADARRKPGPLIALAGVKPGDKVLDLIPGSGYWTRIFSKIVGPDGKVYAVWPQAYARVRHGQRRRHAEALRRQILRQYRHGGSAERGADRARAARRRLDLAKLSTIIPTNIWARTRSPNLLNKAVFKILKPGGTYMIIDHMAKAGARHGRYREAAPDRSGDRPPAASRPRASNSRAKARCSTIPPIPWTSRCSTRRSAGTPASSPTSS